MFRRGILFESTSPLAKFLKWSKEVKDSEPVHFKCKAHIALETKK